MNTFEFRILLDQPISDSDADRLYESIHDDIGVEEGPMGTWIVLDREGEDFFDVALQAVTELMDLGYESVRVEGEAVSASDIAERLHKSRAFISMLTKGERGDGTFPIPAGGTNRSPHWYWQDVQLWHLLNEEDRKTADRFGGVAQGLAAINGVLAQRAMARTGQVDRIAWLHKLLEV